MFGIQLFAVEENGWSRCRAPSVKQNDDPVAVLCPLKADFGDTCGVRVVHHRDRSAHVPGKKFARVGAYPRAIHIWSRVNNAVLDHCGKGDPGGPPIIEMRGDFFDNVCDSVWQRGLRRFNAEAFCEELAGFHVNRSAFDPVSTNVDSKKCQSDILLTASNQNLALRPEILDVPKPAKARGREIGVDLLDLGVGLIAVRAELAAIPLCL